MMSRKTPSSPTSWAAATFLSGRRENDTHFRTDDGLLLPVDVRLSERETPPRSRCGRSGLQLVRALRAKFMGG